MKRVLNFEGKTARWDVPSFLWTENENLVIQFNIQETRDGTHYAAIRCGNRLKEVSLTTSKTVEVPAQFIKDGDYSHLQISLEFRSNKGGAVIVPADPRRGGYFIEPLVIERVEESTTAIAWLQDIERKIDEINARMTEHTKKVNAEIEECKTGIDNVPALIKAAMDETIIYLTNGDLLKA